jgi:2-dehydropantoate 2-reductase
MSNRPDSPRVHKPTNSLTPLSKPAHNFHVSLVARSNYKELADHGVHLQTHTFGDYTFRPHAVFPSVAEAARARPSSGWDYIIVTTKALPDRLDDSALIAPLVGPHSCIVLIQNGLGVEQPHRARFPRNPIVSAVTVISAVQTSPGTVRQNRWTRIHLGPYSDSASFSLPDKAGAGGDSSLSGSSRDATIHLPRGDDTTGALASPLEDPSAAASSSPVDIVAPAAGAGEEDKSALQTLGAHHALLLADWWTRLGGIRDAEATANELELQSLRWHKLCINAAFNPSAVLSGGRGNADMISDPELRKHVEGVMREVWDAAGKVLSHVSNGRSGGKAVFPPPGAAEPERILKSTEKNKGSKPSMLLDWESGRPLELEVILGNPVRIARARGVEMPRLQSLYALLKSAAEMKEREKKAGKEKL